MRLRPHLDQPSIRTRTSRVYCLRIQRSAGPSQFAVDLDVTNSRGRANGGCDTGDQPDSVAPWSATMHVRRREGFAFTQAFLSLYGPYRRFGPTRQRATRRFDLDLSLVTPNGAFVTWKLCQTLVLAPGSFCGDCRDARRTTSVWYSGDVKATNGRADVRGGVAALWLRYGGGPPLTLVVRWHIAKRIENEQTVHNTRSVRCLMAPSMKSAQAQRIRDHCRSATHL